MINSVRSAWITDHKCSMDTEELTSIFRADPFVSPTFQGVFPSDQLPGKIRFPCSIVANTDPADRPGEHWVAYYFDKMGNAEYFDSYGFAPFGNLEAFFKKHGKNHKYNNLSLQGESDSCGHYCVIYLARRNRGSSIKQIVSSYFGKRIGQFDSVVRRLVECIYSSVPLIKIKCNQYCCNRIF